MKKISVLMLFTFLFLGTINAQFEIKINPLGILFNNPDIVGEYMVSEDIGVEAGLGLVYGNYALGLGDLKRSGVSVLVAGKYYFNPNVGGDKFYAGVYLRPRTVSFNDNDGDGFDSGFKQSAVGLGLMTGYKWVSKKNITFEIGLGFGRAFGAKNTYNDNNNTIDFPSIGIDGFGRLSVGYRFGGEK